MQPWCWCGWIPATRSDKKHHLSGEFADLPGGSTEITFQMVLSYHILSAFFVETQDVV